MKRRCHLAWCLGTGWGLAAYAQAQTERRYRIGVLSGGSADARSPFSLESELGRRGFVEGRNLVIDRRFADRDLSRLPALAAELVARQPDVIFTIAGTPGALAAKAATDRIPIVFEASSDPVGTGLVASLSRPGGNLTGSAIFTRGLDRKRMQLLAETLTKPARLAVLDMVRTAERRAAMVDPFPTLPGVSFELFEVSRAAELEAVFQRMARWRASGLVVMHTPTTSVLWADIARLALEHRLPGIADGRQFSEAGLMLTYTTDFKEALERGVEYVSRILAGERPADLPVVQVSRFEMVINRKTAAELGVQIPRALMVQATRVIE